MRWYDTNTDQQYCVVYKSITTLQPGLKRSLPGPDVILCALWLPPPPGAESWNQGLLHCIQGQFHLIESIVIELLMMNRKYRTASYTVVYQVAHIVYFVYFSVFNFQSIVQYVQKYCNCVGDGADKHCTTKALRNSSCLAIFSQAVWQVVSRSFGL